MSVADVSHVVEYVARVQRGAARLDERGPADWRDRLDRSTLDLGDATCCVLGQLYGYADTFDWLAIGLAQLGLLPTGGVDTDEFDEVVIAHGFEEPRGGDYDALTRAWLAYLREPTSSTKETT